MLRRAARSFLRAAEAATPSTTADASKMRVNMTLPHETLFADRVVEQLTVPGSEGVFGVSANHVPVVARMKPGVVSVVSGGRDEKYFVAGGFAFVHRGSRVDITAVDACKVEDLDPAAVKSGVSQYKKAFESATNEVEREKAHIALSVHQAMCYAIGVDPNVAA
eukprot:gnl/Spiro4/15946_TR8571_c0_g1_i1.p1 gnl/Spiro4/15946_TR8571_c0_g1~~gnl/Spiro4/15946_TR8571_c0_g1_i1.p1  ORF type:complete len:179 (+),score=43.74 gnl/Spiro4/15946_TR8571_c0_g1_i1:48-539(+)